ncbi:MAG: hypothetical protein KAR42_17045 [candidate division Zixibacteria bacterium]|nr:hypothetical protein [candidate division Zixibacteria bacterium]
MKKLAYISLFLLFFCATILTARPTEFYIKFTISSKQDISQITKYLSIDNVEDFTVYAYATDRQLEKFGDLGYAYEILPHPGTLIEPEMSSSAKDAMAWDTYPSYDAYVSMMNQFAIDYPGLCEIVDIGETVEGRRLLFARISDNISLQEDEPEVMYTGTMHGDETTGYVLMLRLIDYLLTNYGTDSLATRLVDECEVWINPLANPDGTFAGGNSSVNSATRSNANGVDINRNFPDPKGGPHPDGNAWQPETTAMMAFAEEQSIAISANLHGGIEVVNYPWDTWARTHVDNDWFIMISRDWADSAQYYSPSGYMTAQNNGITNGYAWYEVEGGRQDFMNFQQGCREVTVELSDTKLLPASQLPAHWDYNKAAFLHYLEQGLFGFRGVVTDAVTGDPLAATIKITSHDSDLDSSIVFTDPDVGDYHRMIKTGMYDIEFHAPGYQSRTSKGKLISDYSSLRIDMALTELTDPPALAVVSHNAPVIDPGDDVAFKLTLSNTGAGNGKNINTTLSTTDSYITITQEFSTYPIIYTGGGTGESDVNYQISVSASCPLNHLAQFELFTTADNGYSDTLTFALLVGQIVEDFETSDFSKYPWAFAGNSNWVITSSAPYEGTYCAKSGSINDNQRSEMSVAFDVISAGTISFYYKVSSESGYDYLKFYIDDSEQGSWSGTAGWAQASYPVTVGNHTFKWEYSKDVSQANGSDCGWIDMITFPPIQITIPVEITTTSLPDWTANYAYSQQLTATGGNESYSWSDPNNDLNGSGLSLSSSGLISGTPTSSGGISFTAYVVDTESNSDEKLLSFTVNPVIVVITDSLPDGVTEEVYSVQLTSTGGTGSKTWSDKSNDLNGTGLTLSSSGLLSGTATSSGTITFTSYVEDNITANTEKILSVKFNQAFVCGDANNDDAVNIADAVYIINFAFKGGPSPDPIQAGDVNSDDATNIGDAVYLISYAFKGGPAPNCE